MRRNFPLPGRRHGLGQKEAAAVARVTNAFRNIGAPDQPSSIKRVLQQQGHVKPLRAKLSRQPLAAGKPPVQAFRIVWNQLIDRKSTRLNSSHSQISYAVFCLKKKKNKSPSIVSHSISW